jgi:hypothetical protein
MPNRVKDEEMSARIDQLQERAAEAGRSGIPVTVVGMMRDSEGIERLERAGVHRAVFWLPPDGPGAVEEAFERYVAVVDTYQRAGG